MKQIVLFLYLTLHACAQAYAQFPGKSAPPRLSALVVGVSEYKHSKINDLEFARRDAEQFARLLGCASNVKVDTIIKLLDEDATVANMDMALKYLKSCIDDTTGRKPKPDYVVLFFGGHGQLSSFNEDKEGYFIMHETENASSTDMGYPHRTIVQFIKHRRNKCKFLVISDACHAGRLTGAEELNSTNLPVLSEFTEIASASSVFELLSSEGNGKSYENKLLQHGIFTFYLIKGALGDADEDGDGIIKNGEIGEYVEEKVTGMESQQRPVYNGNKGFFLQFNPCMDYSFDKQVISSGKTGTVSRDVVMVARSPVVPGTRFDSLLYAGMLCSDDKNSAYGELLLARSRNLNPGVYEDMRSRYITAVLDEDATIMHRYLNQDIIPWTSKFADIEKEILMHKSLIDLHRPDELRFRTMAARYCFFQALSWYEYAKFVVNPEKNIRLNKALKLIEQSLEYKPDSPAAFFLRSQVLEALHDQVDPVARAAQLAETLKRAPNWRIPYLYVRTDSAIQKYIRLVKVNEQFGEDKGRESPLLDSLAVLSDQQTVAVSQLESVFARNPVFTEDLYRGYLNEEKPAPEKESQYRELAVKVLSYSVNAAPPVTAKTKSNLPGTRTIVPDKLPLFAGLDKLAASNTAAARIVEAQTRLEMKLDADTVVSEATKARWAELSRIESTPRDTASAKPAGESAGTIPQPEKEKTETPESNPTLPPAVITNGKNNFTDPLTGKFILVKGGTFNMGCTSEQQDCESDEKPVHPVTLSDYYIGETEVTQAQWKAVMGDNPSEFKGCDDCPVEKVSWDDAQEFITRLNARAGSPRYRLPTEAEWEYAARGGANSRGYQYAGSNDINEVAWYSGSSGSKTHPVKGKKPNELGVYDMSGNVREWCSDWFGDYSAVSQTNPQGPSEGIYRVFRGGSWLRNAWNCRASYRLSDEPGYRDIFLGFRLAAPAPR